MFTPISRRKKILQLVHSLNTGGAEILADRFGRHFSKNHDVIFACLDDLGSIGKSLISDGFKVIQLNRGRGIDRQCISRLRKLIRRESIDIIHAHQYTPFFYALASRFMLDGTSVLFTEHGRFLPDKPSLKRMVANRILLRSRDQIIAVGNNVKCALVDNEGLPKHRIDVIYNGIPIEKFRVDKSSQKSKLRQQLNLSPETTLITQVARLDYLKDHTTAIESVAYASRNCSIHLLIVGEGPELDTIQTAIEKHSVQDRVHLLGLRKDIPNILAETDILLLTSISEGIPLTLIEGMATGLPIVSTDVGGVSEVIEHDQNGLLAPAKDSKTIAKHLIALSSDSEKRQRLAELGRKRVVTEFSESNMLRQYDQIISQM